MRQNGSVEKLKLEEEARRCLYNNQFRVTEKSIDSKTGVIETLAGQALPTEYADAPAIISTFDSIDPTPIYKSDED